MKAIREKDIILKMEGIYTKQNWLKKSLQKQGVFIQKKALRSVKNSGENLIHCSVLRRDGGIDLDVLVL